MTICQVGSQNARNPIGAPTFLRSSFSSPIISAVLYLKQRTKPDVHTWVDGLCSFGFHLLCFLPRRPLVTGPRQHQDTSFSILWNWNCCYIPTHESAVVAVWNDIVLHKQLYISPTPTAQVCQLAGPFSLGQSSLTFCSWISCVAFKGML